MNALLQPIIARAIEPASYDNRRIKHYVLWFRDNEAALKARYEELGKAISPHADAFLGFCACQWDIARSQQ